MHVRTPLQGESSGGDLAYNENPALLYVSNAKNLVANANGKTTVNTQCINIGSTAADQTSQHLPGFLGGLGTVWPKDFDFYFGYDSDELVSGVAADTCCLTMYEEDGCQKMVGSEPSCGVAFFPLAASVRSFKVDKCAMLYSEIGA